MPTGKKPQIVSGTTVQKQELKINYFKYMELIITLYVYYYYYYNQKKKKKKKKERKKKKVKELKIQKELNTQVVEQKAKI